MSGLSSLTTLDLRWNMISDIAPLAAMTRLTTLRLAANEITDLRPLASLRSLTTLYLYRNEIAELGPLTGLKSLTTLDLSSNEIGELGPLADLSSLTALDLGDNAISDVAPLAGLTSVWNLSLSRNAIADAAPLASLNALWQLGLDGNRLTALPAGFFADALGMPVLWLHDNPGAPFVLEAVPVLATSAGQRPARVAVRIAEGAPLALEVALEAAGGRVAADAALMPPGAVVSPALDVWPAGREPVVVRVAGLATPSSLYSGIEFAAGPPLVLNDLAEYSDLDEPADVDLAAAFREFEGSPLAFAIRTSDPGVAAAELAGAVLRIVPAGPGTATITVTATTADGRKATRVFDVTVPGPLPLRGWRWALLEGR